MKMYPMSLIIRVKQIKIIMKYQYSLGWQAVMKEREILKGREREIKGKEK